MMTEQELRDFLQRMEARAKHYSRSDPEMSSLVSVQRVDVDKLVTMVRTLLCGKPVFEKLAPPMTSAPAEPQPSKPDGKKFLSASQAASAKGVSLQYLIYHLQRGHVPGATFELQKWGTKTKQVWKIPNPFTIVKRKYTSGQEDR